MEILAGQIQRGLESRNGIIDHYALLEEELQRVWPLNENDRERKIAQFAKDYGFQLTFYRQGLCAIFAKEPPNASV
jgi:hypothetical protein